MDSGDLKEILRKHKIWTADNDDVEGSRADLRGVDLRGANLSGADLSYANLRGADLRGENLRGADLSYANLRGVNLRGVNLSGVNLSGADGIIHIQSSYPYQSYGFKFEDKNYITLGCHCRTIKEWDADFNNNPSEFPEGSPQMAVRKYIYLCMKNWLLNNY